MRTPLAWKNLTSSWSKCCLAAAGVGFAVVLMFMQIGFRNALIDNNVQILNLFDADVASLAIVSQARYNISTEQRFPRSLLHAAAAMPGVVETCAVSVERGTASIQVAGFTQRPIRIIGIELPTTGQTGASHLGFLRDRELYEKLTAADRRGAALLDRRSKPVFGFADNNIELSQQHIELNGRRVPVVDQFSLGTDFANDGTLLMSQRLHGGYFPWRSPSRDPADVVDIGLLHVEGLSEPELDALAQRIEGLAPASIDVRRTGQFITREKEFWAKATPIGKIFLIGTIMGLVVGAIICYQIQFTDISEHMPEFATLKAMGYSTSYFWSIVLCQTLYLAGLGFVPGLLASLGLYRLLAESSGLVMSMTWDRILLVWALTLAMCFISGVLAIRKLFRADPASLF